nr:MAG TPA: hypothetical protein [Caudoviricetes sp.]
MANVSSNLFYSLICLVIINHSAVLGVVLFSL